MITLCENHEKESTVYSPYIKMHHITRLYPGLLGCCSVGGVARNRVFVSLCLVA